VGEPAARVTDDHSCPDFIFVATTPVPHVGGPVQPPGAPTVKIGGQPAARLGDFAQCVLGPTDVIAGGASTVLIGQLPATRVVIDKTVHKGIVKPPGMPTVKIGGPSFSLPPNFDLRGSPDFQNKLVRDLYFLSTTNTGKQLIDRLAASGQTITFKPTDDGNEESEGIFGGATVYYNPDGVRQMQDAAGNWTSRPPVVGLAHEMVHALGDVEGNAPPYGNIDPSPPPSEPNIRQEEARAIGTGSYTGSSPSENSLRQEMGLPQRANHYGRPPPAGTPAPANPRPGG
jgi:uncharacterized Zn-binding protein involved in type VI secretion